MKVLGKSNGDIAALHTKIKGAIQRAANLKALHTKPLKLPNQ